ncbi:MAG: hypothetical protein R3C68_12405 [Myxococcota bacterium]
MQEERFVGLEDPHGGDGHGGAARSQGILRVPSFLFGGRFYTGRKGRFVGGTALSESAISVDLVIYIQPEYVKLIRKTSKFWVSSMVLRLTLIFR